MIAAMMAWRTTLIIATCVVKCRQRTLPTIGVDFQIATFAALI
jgi:hypothetical protein